MTTTYIHRVTYQTPDGAREWTYATATITEPETATAAIRETADRQAAETDPALEFVSHSVTDPHADDAAPEEPTA